jgi:hypothetical protein
MFQLYCAIIRPSKEQIQSISVYEYSAFWDPQSLQAFGIPECTINVDILDLFFRRPDDGPIELKHVALSIFENKNTVAFDWNLYLV